MALINRSGHEKMRLWLIFLTILFGLSIQGCAQHSIQNGETAQAPVKSEPAKKAKDSSLAAQLKANRMIAPSTGLTTAKPAIKWKPSYSLTQVHVSSEDAKLPDMKVGANINSKNGKVPLHTVIRSLADLKGMNVSWSSDVNQEALVNVNIKADSSFWDALNDVLRQVDYFYEFENDTIIVKYKDTQRFHITSPFLTGSYRTAVGGDFLGNAGEVETGLQGELSVEHNDDNIDLWATIQENISRILDLATLNVPETASDNEQDMERIRRLCRQRYPANPARQALCVQQQQAETQLHNNNNNGNNSQGGQGDEVAAGTGRGSREGFYFTIDKPLGIITVTAPRSILEKVKTYVDNLHEALCKQVIIEAKIIEVQLDDSSSKGVDWSQLLKESPFTFSMTFGKNGQIYPTDGIKFLESVTMTRAPFDLVLNFLDEFGNVKVLSNPKLSLLNGQPAMITGGRTTRYIDSVTTVVDNSAGGATTSYTIKTKDILSGIGLGVIANIESDDEIVLQLTPVNSRLANITTREFGSFMTGYAEVDLPEVNLREMTTMAKVKSGQLLIIGGIIDETSGTEGNKVPILGDIPLIGYAFKSETKFTRKRELVILLRPQIVEI